ncbi:hypothetical protein LZ30DRAFT_705918 [Colletotrichum cereale]|nr:hypothetical protein LZ30DRAFT_705918 [Colletotrichum cereale]
MRSTVVLVFPSESSLQCVYWRRAQLRIQCQSNNAWQGTLCPLHQQLTSRSKVAARQSASAEGSLGVVADVLGLVRLEAAGAETSGERRDGPRGMGRGAAHVGIHLVGSVVTRLCLTSARDRLETAAGFALLYPRNDDPLSSSSPEQPSRHGRPDPSRLSKALASGVGSLRGSAEEGQWLLSIPTFSPATHTRRRDGAERVSVRSC